MAVHNMLDGCIRLIYGCTGIKYLLVEFEVEFERLGYFGDIAIFIYIHTLEKERSLLQS